MSTELNCYFTKLNWKVGKRISSKEGLEVYVDLDVRF